ncbi:unnamed protein product, partial [Rotaria sp. Silwood1]
ITSATASSTQRKQPVDSMISFVFVLL